MSGRAFIPDGYTAETVVKAVPNLYEAVRFKFRPVLPEAIRALMHKFYEEKTAQQQSEIINETLKRQIIEWDIRDPKGELVEITINNLNHITKPLKERLFNIVTCYDGGDGIPGDGQDSKLDYDALLTGEGSTEEGPEAQAKN